MMILIPLFKKTDPYPLHVCPRRRLSDVRFQGVSDDQDQVSSEAATEKIDKQLRPLRAAG